MTEITFTDAAIDDLRRIGPDAVPRVLKRLLPLEENPGAGYPLGGGLAGFRKLVVGRNTWRIVYRITGAKQVEVCEVWDVGARADAQVYAEAARRVRACSGSSPEVQRLATVLGLLGRSAGVPVPDAAEPREPVPTWLADRLVYTVGMSREEVAALDLEKAVDLWADYRAGPQ